MELTKEDIKKIRTAIDVLKVIDAPREYKDQYGTALRTIAGVVDSMETRLESK